MFIGLNFQDNKIYENLILGIIFNVVLQLYCTR